MTTLPLNSAALTGRSAQAEQKRDGQTGGEGLAGGLAGELGFAVTLGFVQSAQQGAENAARDAQLTRTLDQDATLARDGRTGSGSELSRTRSGGETTPDGRQQGAETSTRDDSVGGRSGRAPSANAEGATAASGGRGEGGSIASEGAGSTATSKSATTDAGTSNATTTSSVDGSTGGRPATFGVATPAIGSSGAAVRAAVTLGTVSRAVGQTSPNQAVLPGRGATGPEAKAGRAFKVATPRPPAGQSAELARQVSRGLAQLLRTDGGTLRMKLAPASLGEVRIDLRVSQGRVEGVLHAESNVARELLSGELTSLRAALESRGVSVDRLEVRSPAEPAGSSVGGGSADGRGSPDGQDAHGAGSGHDQRERGAARDRTPLDEGAPGGGADREQDDHAEGVDRSSGMPGHGRSGHRVWRADGTLSLDTVA